MEHMTRKREKTKKFYPPTTLQLIWKMKLKVQAEAADADVTDVADDEDAPPGEDLLLTLIRHHLWQSTPLLSQLFFSCRKLFSLGLCYHQKWINVTTAKFPFWGLQHISLNYILLSSFFKDVRDSYYEKP